MLTTEKHIYVACNLAEIAEREDGYYTANNGTEVSFSLRNDDETVSIEDLEELQEAIMVFLQLRHEKSKQRAEEIPPGEWSTTEECHLPTWLRLDPVVRASVVEIGWNDTGIVVKLLENGAPDHVILARVRSLKPSTLSDFRLAMRKAQFPHKPAAESTGDSKPTPPSAITWGGTWEEFEDARLKYAEAEDYRTQQEAANSQESSL